MPIIATGSAASTQTKYAHEQTDSSTKNLMQCWREWEKEGPPGYGELREIAVARLMACLNYKQPTLDLSNLQLRTLPDKLPPHITTLILTGNALSHLPVNQPASLQRIDIANHETLENDPLLSEKEVWQTNGHELHLKIEDEKNFRQQAQKIFTPRRIGLASGIAAGIMLFTGLGSWIHQRWTATNTPERNNDIATGGTFLWPGDEPLALFDKLAVSNTTSQKLMPDELPTPEQILLTYFNQTESINREKPAKEVVVATIAGAFFSAPAHWQPEENVMTLARHILRQAGEYGGEEGEQISLRQAKTAIRQWIFYLLFAASPREYIANKIIAEKRNAFCNLSMIKAWLAPPSLDPDTHGISPERVKDFETMWLTIIHEDLPLLNVKFAEAHEYSLTEFPFFALSTGAEYLADANALDLYDLKEIATVGTSIWEKMISENANVEFLPYLITPSLWYAASSAPEVLYLHQPAQAAVAAVLEIWRNAQQRISKIEKCFTHYQTALQAWRSKGVLADIIIARCPKEDLIYLPGKSGDSREQVESKKIKLAKDRYMSWEIPPCEREDVPASLSTEYKRLTLNVADRFKNLDHLLIESALSMADKADYDFITSPTATLHPVSLDMKTLSTPVAGPGGVAWSGDITITAQYSDLFSVKNNNQERIYALKRGDDINSGYTLYWLDRDIDLYIKKGILSHPHMWKSYSVDQDRVFAGGYEFRYKININPQIVLSLKPSAGKLDLISFFSDSHHNAFYKELFNSGNDDSDAQKIWNNVKHFIPFYDCVEGIASGEPGQVTSAIPSCFLDALAFIPVVGQATAVGGKYGLSLVQGLRSIVFKAGQRATIEAMAKVMAKSIALPSSAELQQLLTTTLRAMDPGVELLFRAGAKTINIATTINDPLLAAKVRQHMPANTLPKKIDYRTARLGDSGAEVRIKKAGEERWVMVNPQTDEAFGKYYYLQEGKLREVAMHHHWPQDQVVPGPSAQHPLLEVASPPADNNARVPAAGYANYWNIIRKVVKTPSPDIFIKQNTELQKLDKFIPEPFITIHDQHFINKALLESFNIYYASHPWCIYPATGTLSSKTPPWITPLQAEIRIHLETSRHKIAKALSILRSTTRDDNLINSVPGQYLAGMLNTQQPQVINEAFARLLVVTKRADLFMRASKGVYYSNFFIVSSRFIVDPGNPNNYITTLSANTLQRLPNASTLLIDQEARIFIYADKIQNQGYNDSDNPVFKNLNTDVNMPDTIIHEVSHSSSYTGDNFIHTYPDKGRLSNGADINNFLSENLKSKKTRSEAPPIYALQDFKFFIKELIFYQGISNPLPQKKVIEAIQTDPMLYANIMMSDAETIATIIRDIAEGNTFDAILRAKREADLLTTESPPNITMAAQSVNNAMEWLALPVTMAMRGMAESP